MNYPGQMFNRRKRLFLHHVNLKSRSLEVKKTKKNNKTSVQAVTTFLFTGTASCQLISVPPVDPHLVYKNTEDRIRAEGMRRH